MHHLYIIVSNGRQVNLQSAKSSVPLQRAIPARQPALTRRETQVLRFVAEGLANRQTAVEMNVSIKTVQKHRQSLMNKLNLHDTAALTRFAVARGILFDEQFRQVLARRWHAYSVREPAKLTCREQQVLKLIAEGLVNKQIASELNISIKTVVNHRDGLMKRLDIHEVAGLTRYAISSRLIGLSASA
jgi:DNA-binding NarL/FixJ family response regulator